MKRRDFMNLGILGTIGLSISCNRNRELSKKRELPVVISTWKHGIPANEKAWEILSIGGRALDAVEEGVKISEADPKVSSVGYGGLPDREGNVTLDACIMDEYGNCGSVAFLKGIKHPISVARLIMEKTPHIMLVGDGALKFALENGFKQEDLLTEEARNEWIKWKTEQMNKVNEDIKDKLKEESNHDTIAMLAIDLQGNISGACTTSGLAWKYYGRVGDSPIIGAGLYCDNDVGAAGATGRGEAVIKIAGSFLIVELMRGGMSPFEACREAVKRIIQKQKDYMDFQVGFIALNKYGETGAYSIHKGFEYALYSRNVNKLIEAEFEVKKQI